MFHLAERVEIADVVTAAELVDVPLEMLGEPAHFQVIGYATFLTIQRIISACPVLSFTSAVAWKASADIMA